MPKQLKDIEVSHISLVKKGANQKTVIYKSADDKEPEWVRHFAVKKSDEKKGIVYGIVYSPDQEDTQGDFAKAHDIELAAYDFMKAKRLDNVDKDHTFEKEDAFVCESWIVRKGDSMFGDESEGSWAVGIKLESEELKKAVKDGEITGLSMAGKASKSEVEKAEKGTLDELVETLKSIFSSVHFNVSGSHYKREIEKSQGENLNKDEIAKAFADVLAEGLKPLNEKIEGLEKSLDEHKVALKKSDEAIVKHEEMFAKSKQFFAFEKKKNESSDSIMA